MKKSMLACMLLLPLSLMSTQVFASDTDCEKLKAKIEKQLKAKGDSGSYVKIYEADDQVEGKDMGRCGGGAMKVVLFEVDAS